MERRQALCHPRSCLLAYTLNVLHVSMVRSAGLEIRGRTVRCFCRYLFFIPTTTMKAILRLLIRPSLILLLLIRRRHSKASNDRSDDELRAAYLQGARDAMSDQGASRYGEHYTDSRERRRQEPQEERKSDQQSESSDENAAPAPAPVEDKSTPTIFIFKDGHQLETKNYAIMGGTLFDFSGKVLKKIQMDEIDSAATLKANDDRGVVMKLN